VSRINPWIVLLLVSVLANGVLIGVVARGLHAPGPPSTEAQAPRERPDFSLRAFAAELPPEIRAEARAQFRAERRDMIRLMRDAFQARRRALNELVREDFDPERAAQALSDARAARARLEERTEALVLEAVAELGPDARRRALRRALSGRLDEPALGDDEGPRDEAGR